MDILEEARRTSSAYVPRHYSFAQSPYEAEQEDADVLHFFRTATGPRGARGGRQTRHASFRPRTMPQSPMQIYQQQPARTPTSAATKVKSFSHPPPNDSEECLGITPEGGIRLSARGRVPGRHSESDATLLFRAYPEVSYSSLYPPRAASLPASIPPRRRVSVASERQRGKGSNRGDGVGAGVRFKDILGLSPSEFEDMGRPKTPISNTRPRPPPPPLSSSPSSSSPSSPLASAAPLAPAPPHVVAEESGQDVSLETPFEIPPPLHSKFPNVTTAVAIVRHRARKGMQRRQEAIDEALIEILSELSSNISLVERTKFDDVHEDYFHGQDSICTMCPICTLDFEDFDATRNTKCGHVYHKNCLDTWLGYGHRTCPMCRGDVYGEDD